MAGIGFRLEKILSKNSYLNLMEGYAYSAIVSAGPVLLTIFSLGIISSFTLGGISGSELIIFRSLVVYIYGISLITSSPAQMVITRYLSDRIFLDDFKAIVPAFVGLVSMSVIVNGIISAVGMAFLDFDFGTKITAVVLFVCISIIWIAMIVLSAAKEFIWIVKSFAIGSVISVVCGYYLGSELGVLGLITGYTIGQVVLVILLLIQIFTEFEYRGKVEFYFLEYFKKYSSLAFIATFYNLGIWADKFVFWFSDATSQEISGFLRASAIYDAPIFMAYLFIIPSLAMFTVRIETSFYIHYKKYFLAILNKHPLSSVQERHRNITNDLLLSMGRMVVMQGTVTIIGLVMAPRIYAYLGMSSISLGVFQIAILATFMQALLQTLLIMALYFDFRTDALIMSIIFMVSNTVLSIISIRLGLSYYGYGYFLSGFLTLMTGFFLFNYRLKNLIYYTFVGQKMIAHKEV